VTVELETGAPPDSFTLGHSYRYLMMEYPNQMFKLYLKLKWGLKTWLMW
jgi:hypothetical protein